MADGYIMRRDTASNGNGGESAAEVISGTAGERDNSRTLTIPALIRRKRFCLYTPDVDLETTSSTSAYVTLIAYDNGRVIIGYRQRQGSSSLGRVTAVEAAYATFDSSTGTINIPDKDIFFSENMTYKYISVG